ncbi:MAG: YebC/PmpR family DNA-binding transcriptional regulator [Phycisphaeraceae bacterium]|nr:YebC/PmpR family DNA-binding transcriptional regulator [Phycisphaeraceae bacterium]
MAGHNKWSKIKHRKAVVDKRRGKVWTKVAKAIIVAAKNGGPDPDSNLSLRYAIDEARYANMPRDTIERAIQKGAGGAAGDNYEPVRYEGYGPGGVAIIVDSLTDNRARTVGDLRLAFGNHGGNLGNNGCVAYMFAPKGQIVFSAPGLSEERIMELAVNAGADDVLSPDDPSDPAEPWTILAAVPAFQQVKEAIEKSGAVIAEAGIAMVPAENVVVSGQTASTVISLIDAIEDLDDVQKVYTNADITDEG